MSLLEAVRRNRERRDQRQREETQRRLLTSSTSPCSCSGIGKRLHNEGDKDGDRDRAKRKQSKTTATKKKKKKDEEGEEAKEVKKEKKKKEKIVVSVVHPKAFYGGKHWRKQDEHASSGPAGTSVWYDTFRTFPRQGLMFDFVDKQKKPTELLHYFTYETHGTKKRAFLSTSLRRFWRHYSVMPRFKRHFYELIRQGSPCKMYYDLEFPLELNEAQAKAGVGDQLVDMTIDLTCAEVLDRFGISIDKDHIVELDSTTDRKFSRHLIIPLGKDKALASNAHAGAIAAAVVGRIYEKITEEGEKVAQTTSSSGRGSRFKQLLVRGSGDSDRLTPFIDLSVYSRNRTFRIFRSSKCGKDVELIPTKRYFGKMWHHKGVGGERVGGRSVDDRSIFMHSLICSVPSTADLLCCQEIVEAVSASKKFKPSYALHPNPYDESKQRLKRSSPSIQEGEGHFQKFPCLSRFIESTKSPDGTPRLIRSYVMFQETATIILNLKSNRYCDNVKRQHKSNGVFLVVDVKLGYFYQKCYDPDCRHFRGDSHVLPLDVMAELNSVFECCCGDEEESSALSPEPYSVQEEIEDEAFLLAVQELEQRHISAQS